MRGADWGTNTKKGSRRELVSYSRKKVITHPKVVLGMLTARKCVVEQSSKKKILPATGRGLVNNLHNAIGLHTKCTTC